MRAASKSESMVSEALFTPTTRQVLSSTPMIRRPPSELANPQIRSANSPARGAATLNSIVDVSPLWISFSNASLSISESFFLHLTTCWYLEYSNKDGSRQDNSANAPKKEDVRELWGDSGEIPTINGEILCNNCVIPQ